MPSEIFAFALETIREGCLITDANRRATYANGAFTAITGYGPDEIIGYNSRILQGPGTDTTTIDSMRLALGAGETFSGRILNYRKDGRSFWNDLTITPARDASGEITHFVSSLRDVTAQVELEDRLEYLRLFDDLTDLPNRPSLVAHIVEALARARQSGSTLAVGLIDLDKFKDVNDNYGHSAGDTVLEDFARRIQDRLRSADFVARLGGDEFAVVIEGLTPGGAQDQLANVLDRLHASVDEPFEVAPGIEINVGMSMGLALFPSDAHDPGELLRQADQAMYEAKGRQGETRRWWELAKAPSAGGRGRREAPSEGDSQGAMLHMQPLIDLRSGRVVRVEGLARVRMSDGSILSAEEFVPTFAPDQLDAVFRFVVRQAAEALQAWNNAELNLGISVNIASSTLRAPGLVNWLMHTLGGYGVSPDRLTLELVQAGDPQLDIERGVLSDLLARGFKLDLDDPGLGMSTAQRLPDLPFNTLRFDLSAFARLDTKPLQTIELLETAARLGAGYERDVVAEGLDDDGMIEVVAMLGFSHGQGDGLGRPMPAAEVPEWVRNFRYPIVPGQVRTYAGALAFQVKTTRSEYPVHPAMEECPLTSLLLQRSTTAARLHDDLHAAGRDCRAQSEALTQWLVREITAEAVTAA